MRLGDLPSNFRTYICEHVFRAERAVAFVAFEEDGSLVMTCGGLHQFNGDSVKVVGIGHLLDRHHQLNSIELRPGLEAALSEAGEWHTQPLQPKKDET